RRKLYRLYRQLETGHLPTVTFGELGTDISIVDETLPPRRVKRPTEERALSRCWMVTPHWFRIRRALLEKESGLKLGEFSIGYSPERINPGDKEHSIDKIYKIVSACNSETTEKLARIYGKITRVYKVTSIKTAEAAKVIENIQRDINIALFNELATLFDTMKIDAKEVFDAAATKWNFYRFYPGLVGGHCIPVDPYYLAHKAQEIGHIPELLLAGRRVNENLPSFIAQKTIKLLINTGKSLKNARILIMGATYKENVPDLRDSKVRNLIYELRGFGLGGIQIYEPLVKRDKIFNIKNKEPQGRFDVLIYAVNHEKFKNIKVTSLLSKNGIFIDIKRAFDKEEIEDKGFIYWGL
ncbi:MAG TPA: nucleotide sugar dehydrogenase, partial [Candidatus Altiarchaeales archaeon]|nr:nucleotide sugar dehydrogenase [Candidatus Altiarchaeales archaeon]